MIKEQNSPNLTEWHPAVSALCATMQFLYQSSPASAALQSSLFICRCGYMTFPNAIHLHMKVPLFFPQLQVNSLMWFQSSAFPHLELTENHPPLTAKKPHEMPNFHNSATLAINNVFGWVLWFIAVPLIPNRAQRAKLQDLKISHEMATDNLQYQSIFANRPQTYDGSLWSS